MNNELAKTIIEELEKRISISKERIKFFDNYLEELRKKIVTRKITPQEYNVL